MDAYETIKCVKGQKERECYKWVLLMPAHPRTSIGGHLRLVHLLKVRRCLYNPGGRYLPGWRVWERTQDVTLLVFSFPLVHIRSSVDVSRVTIGAVSMTTTCCCPLLICLSLFSIPPSHPALNAVLVFQGQSGSCGDRQRDSGRDLDESARGQKTVKTTGEKT